MIFCVSRPPENLENCVYCLPVYSFLKDGEDNEKHEEQTCCSSTRNSPILHFQSGS